MKMILGKLVCRGTGPAYCGLVWPNIPWIEELVCLTRNHYRIGFTRMQPSEAVTVAAQTILWGWELKASWKAMKASAGGNLNSIIALIPGTSTAALLAHLSIAIRHGPRLL